MFVKLFHTILKSSVWLESPTTRIVWITFLLEADEDGMVRGVDALLAAAARVTPEEFAAAIDVLQSPDIQSQTQDFGGRRIERVEGGWLVLNYRKYREYRTRAQVKEADKKRRQRAKSHADNGIGAESTMPDAVVPGHVPNVPTIASVSYSVPAVKKSDRQLFAQLADTGEHLNWCSECGGAKVDRGGSVHLRHRDWCSRRTG